MIADPLTRHVPPIWGNPLDSADLVNLESSWINSETANVALLRRVNAVEGREAVAQKGNRDCAGILIPYYWPGEERPYNYRLRRDNPEFEVSGNGARKTKAKYLGPPRGSNRLYVPIGVTLEQLADTSLPIVIVEGEKKAIALWRLANHEVERPRFIPIALSGVWNWRGTVGKTGGPKGERIDVKGPIADLNRIAWVCRQVNVVFDANVWTNESVQWARKGVCRELASRDASVSVINLPKDCDVNGVDDLLGIWGPSRVLELFDHPVPVMRLEVVQSPQYQARSQGLFRVTTKGERLAEVQLTTYTAEIAVNICLDDGLETKREFEIVMELLARKMRFTIAANEFAKMDWPMEKMGGSAITFPSQRDHARTAIQSLSLGAEERSIYTHTGWRLVDGGWIFLHAGGAITSAGMASDLNVRLSGSLGQLELLLPAGPEELSRAIRSSLRLAELGPPALSFPLLAATYRAVLGEADFALHLAGETGAFKSEVAALHQQHFGARMDRRHLPGAWSSTGNALEVLAFHGKDVLLVIDDFAPQGNTTDVAKYHGAADRVFRAAGNHAGRARLNSSAALQGAKPPRGLILSTGEEIPRGQSIRARLLILELSKHQIQAADLTVCQNDARNGLYSQAMGAYLQWMAGSRDQLKLAFERTVSQYRPQMVGNTVHARTPETLAQLQAGFEMFLNFALETEGIDASERDELAQRCWESLRLAAAAQTSYQSSTEPAERFLSMLSSVLTSGRAHLAARCGGPPAAFSAGYGWREMGGSWTPAGECVGWIDGDDLYLDSSSAFRVVQVAGRDIGETLPIGEQTLRKRLQERGKLASTDSARETLTVRRLIGGVSRNVLHLRRNTLLPDVSDGDEDAE